MKTFRLLAAAACAAMLSLSAACSSSAKTEGETATPQETAQEEQAGVVTLQDDNMFRPGQQVPMLTVLDFNSEYCVPCKKLAPAYEIAAEKYNGKVNFYSVDIVANPATAEAFEVELVPVVIFISPDGTITRYDSLDDFISKEDQEKYSADLDGMTQVIYGSLSEKLDGMLK